MQTVLRDEIFSFLDLYIFVGIEHAVAAAILELHQRAGVSFTRVDPFRSSVRFLPDLRNIIKL